MDSLHVNLGYLCSQSCLRCHANAGPNRTEEMSGDTTAAILAFLSTSPGLRTLDLTGGASELNPHFRSLVTAARSRGVHVIDHCNLTNLEVRGQKARVFMMKASMADEST